MKLFSILLVAVSPFAVSCERHEFEGATGTKQLNEVHGASAHEPAAGHGDHPAAGQEHEEKKPAH